MVIPAVLPCGECAFCREGRDNICLHQKMPGNDLDGGFATHITVPSRFLIPVKQVPSGHTLAHLAVVADAVTTPYQALLRARVQDGDTVVVIGAGGIGIYGIQLAAVFGARVIAVDINPDRIEQAMAHGAAAGVVLAGADEREGRKQIAGEAKKAGLPRERWKILEMSGTAPGQRLAYALLSHAGTLGIVGFTRDKVEVRLSNLMAFDADAFGSWGCSPRHYPPVLDLIAEGRIQIKPFVTFEPLDSINEVLSGAHHGTYSTGPSWFPGPRARRHAGNRQRRRKRGDDKRTAQRPPPDTGTALGPGPGGAKPVLRPDGTPAPGLHNVWITLNNPDQLNSYTTDMVKEVILAFRRASNDRAAVAVVFTGAGTRAFCTGGNTKEYAEVYAARPQEYRQYMRLFNDMVSVHPCLRQAGDQPGQRDADRRRAGDRDGLRLHGGLGSGHVRTGRAQARLGPRWEAAPTSSPLYVGAERAMQSCTLCEMWSAHQALPATG